MRRSTVAHFACKVRGDEFCGDQARLIIQQSHALERWPCSLRVRGPHFASKVSYNAGAATDDCAAQRKSPLRGCCRRPFIFPNFAHLCLSANAGAGTTESGSRDERVWEQRRTHTGWRSPKGIGAEAEAMFFRLSALFPVSGHQRQLAACTEKRRCKTRMGCATPLFIKEHLFNAL